MSRTEPEFVQGLTPATNTFKRISWAAVFAGVLIAIVIQISLTLLGMGIGLSTVDPLEENNPVAGLGIAAAIWYVVSGLVALFAGGWVAGRLARSPRMSEGVIHGLLSWALMTMVVLYFLTTTLGNIFGGIGRLAGGAVKAVGNVAGKGIEQAMPGIRDEMKEQGLDLGNLKKEAETLLRQTGKADLQPAALGRRADAAVDSAKGTAQSIGENPTTATGSVDGLFDQLFNQGKEVGAALDKDAMVNVIMQRTGKTKAEAETIADNWIASYDQAKIKWEQTKKEAELKAREIADKAAKAVSGTAILAFVSLLLGAGAAGFGARAGTLSKDDELLVKS
ncbi:MAG: hypothetical protein ABW036_09065 [Flavitalea sp.]